MYVYVGKLNWPKYAENECITIVFPAGFALKDPVCAYWQWTVDGAGVQKNNHVQEGFITSVTNTTSEYRVRFPFDYYAFEGTVAADFALLSLEMTSPGGERHPVSLSLEHGDDGRVPSASVFTGKLNWSKYSQNEMVTLTVPGDVANGEPVVLSYQWTVDGSGVAKKNHIVKDTLKSVDSSSDGAVTAKFGDGYYKFKFTVPKSSGGDVVLHMGEPSGDAYSGGPYNLKQTDFRDLRKKKVGHLDTSTCSVLELEIIRVNRPTNGPSLTGPDRALRNWYRRRYLSRARHASEAPRVLARGCGALVLRRRPGFGAEEVHARPGPADREEFPGQIHAAVRRRCGGGRALSLRGCARHNPSRRKRVW